MVVPPSSRSARSVPVVRPLALLAFVLATLGAGGCSLFEFQPEEVVFVWVGGDELNPNPRGESTQLNVRVYQLTDCTKFEEATRDELWGDASQRLGDTLVTEAAKFRVAVEQRGEAVIALEDETTHIGVLGLFEGEPDGEAKQKICLPVYEFDDYVYEFRGFQMEAVRR